MLYQGTFVLYHKIAILSTYISKSIANLAFFRIFCQWGVFNVTKRADGRFQRSVVDERTGKRKYFYGKSEREVIQKILQYEEENNEGIPFKKAADDWWEYAEDGLAMQSRKAYRPAMRRAVEHFGDTPIKTIRPRDINIYLKVLTRDDITEKTLAKYRLVLNLIFNYALTDGYIEVNPCSAVRSPKARASIKRESAGRIDEEIVKRSADVWIFPFLVLMTGMRKGEALALQWKDIDFDKNRITVSKSVAHDGDRPIIKEPKTKKGSRTIPLLAPLRDELLKIEERHPDGFIVQIDGIAPLTNRRYLTAWEKYKKETGVTCTAHQLRHSFATIAFECGVSVKSVQEILGHKQIGTTMDLYTDFRDKSISQAEKLLNDSF